MSASSARFGQSAYVLALGWIGSGVGRLESERARAAFLKGLTHLERRFGVPGGQRPVMLPSGTRLFCNLSDNLQAELYYVRSYARRELSILREHLSPGEVFLDVGAHVGLFAIELARQVGKSGTVLAFEPSPDTAAQLRRNVAINQLQDVVNVFETALGKEDEIRPLYGSPLRPSDAGMRSLFTSGQHVADVPVRSLDSLVESGALGPVKAIDAVKIDVEGAELLALEGMKKTLSACAPRIVFVETVPSLLERTDSSEAQIVELMSGIGYVVSESLSAGHPNTAFIPA